MAQVNGETVLSALQFYRKLLEAKAGAVVVYESGGVLRRTPIAEVRWPYVWLDGNGPLHHSHVREMHDRNGSYRKR